MLLVVINALHLVSLVMIGLVLRLKRIRTRLHFAVSRHKFLLMLPKQNDWSDATGYCDNSL